MLQATAVLPQPPAAGCSHISPQPNPHRHRGAHQEADVPSPLRCSSSQHISDRSLLAQPWLMWPVCAAVPAYRLLFSPFYLCNIVFLNLLRKEVHLKTKEHSSPLFVFSPPLLPVADFRNVYFNSRALLPASGKFFLFLLNVITRTWILDQIQYLCMYLLIN